MGHLLWRCPIKLKVFKFQPDPLILESQERVGALGHVVLRVQEGGGLEGSVLRGRVRCRDELLVAS